MVTISVGSDLYRHMREVMYATKKCFMYETSIPSTWQLPSCTGAQGLFTYPILFGSVCVWPHFVCAHLCGIGCLDIVYSNFVVITNLMHKYLYSYNITILYMFRALLSSSSGGSIVYVRHLVLSLLEHEVIVYSTLFTGWKL